jgi:hypothetical protein
MDRDNKGKNMPKEKPANEVIRFNVTGHLLIRDKDTGDILLDKNNAIHFENYSLAVARSLADKANGPIERIYFGNGGSTVNGIGEITYLPTNTIGQSADLYNPTYSKIVDDENVSNPSPTTNKMTISHVSGNLFSDLIVTATLDFGEPTGQENFDSAASTEGNFVFDEIGLKDYAGNLLTHVIFHPVQKSLNRQIEIVYTLRNQLV